MTFTPFRAEDFHDLYAVASDPLIIDSKDSQVIGSSRFHGYD